MGMRRRDFIKLLTGTTTFSLACGYGLFSNLQARGPAEAWAAEMDEGLLRPPEEKWIPTVCQQCQGGCGILVRVYGDRAVKIDGNPLHPINRGTLCARGQAGLQWLYDPDRIKGPLARTGARGEGGWKSISWDEALATVAEKLETLRQAETPHALALLTGAQGGGLRTQISERFMEAYGSPNIIRCEPNRSAGMVPAVQLMQGRAAGVTYDIEDAGFILSLNSSFLEDHWSAVQVQQAYGKFRRGRHKLRGKFVHMEPRLSVTGAKADEWVPMNPGTEGILAMGIASVLIIERRYDESFVEQRTFGFDDWRDKAGRLRPGFKTVVLREYPLDKVVETTGVPRDTIIRVAREFARVRPAIAIGNDSPTIGSQGIHDRMAIHALNALVGNIQEKGGVLAQARLPEIGLSPYTPDGIAVNGLSMERLDGAGAHEYALADDVPASLADRIQRKRPYPLEMVLLHGANPLYTSSEPEKLLSALKQVPTIVSFSSFMDDTSRYADLILPDSTYLEKWQLETSYTLKGNPVVNMARPVIPPILDTRDTSEVFLLLTQAMGDTLKSAFPAYSIEALVQGAAEDLHASSRGEPFGAPLEELWTKFLEQSGWQPVRKEKVGKFFADLLERGGWWDPVYYPWEWKRVLSTPSERFEFYSLTAKNYLDNLQGMARDLAVEPPGKELGLEKDDAFCLPHGTWSIAEGSPSLYDLEINPYVIPVLSGLSHTNQPWLQDITGFHVYENWHTWVEMNPETAHKMHLHNKDWVWVESPAGKIKARVRLYAGAMPGVINLPVGLGHVSGGRWTGGIGTPVSDVLHGEKDFLSGRTRFQRTRARLTKTGI